jgi:K+-sensing histidine kinase KdpD
LVNSPEVRWRVECANVAGLHNTWQRYLVASVAVAVVVSALVYVQPHANLATVALALVLVVTLCAVNWGSGPALLAALWGGLCFNYFFIPPIRTWSIDDPQNWIALSAFVATALIVGQLSSQAKKKAREAESRRLEIEQLYTQLTKAFEEASEAESLRRSEKLKTALLDAVTHDLRTPLTSIKASVTALLGPSLDGAASWTMLPDARRELLEVINEESDRLNRFVEEMMELAQVESGHLLLQPSPTSAHDIINTALDRATALLQRHAVEVTIEDKLPLLHVDAASISNVIFELLENAAKYSPTGSAVHVTAKRLPGQLAQLSVEDEGSGIPSELRDRVFEKFFRTAGAQRDTQGFGLGLAIARGIVEAHRGRIWVDGPLHGPGTLVAFTVPCEEVA